MKRKSKNKKRSDSPYAKRRSKVPAGKKRAAPRVRKAAAPSADNLRRGDTLVGDPFIGIFRASERGFGFVVPDQGGEDFFVPPPYTGGAMNGDRVEVKRLAEREGGRGSEAAVIKVTERKRDYLIGTLKTDGITVWMESDDRTVKAEVTSFTVYAQPGDKVELKIEHYPDDYKEKTVRGKRHKKTLSLSGQVVANYGEEESREANYAAILREHGIPTEFPDEVITQAKKKSAMPLTPEGREDLRRLTVFTIDGADAKDLDDAISIERGKDGYVLGVHIADVSHYVTAGSHLDREALRRGSSVYFIDKVVPMLPKELSNGACSLNAGEDKYALSAFVRISGAGEITDYEFKKSLIRSAVRGVYSEVNDLLEKGDSSEFAEKYSPVRRDLGIMHELYCILRDRAKARGVLELDSPEAKIILGEDGLPSEVIPRVRGDGEKMIEQFMLCANIAAASFMEEQRLPGVYRVHQSPDSEKLRSFVIFAHNAGLDVSAIGSVSDDGAVINGTAGTRELSAVIAEAEEKGMGEIISSVMLRSMMKAKYQGSPAPHFGLGVPLYAHFTSPIRRYPDLFIHRVISAHLAGKRKPSFDRAQNAASVSSEREIAVQTAERQIETLYLCLWMKGHLGEEFDGQVSGVTQSGLFVRTEMMCEGFVPEEALGRIADYNEHTLTLRVSTLAGDRTYSLGDRIRVTAVHVDLLGRRITFGVAR